MHAMPNVSNLESTDGCTWHSNFLKLTNEVKSSELFDSEVIMT